MHNRNEYEELHPHASLATRTSAYNLLLSLLSYLFPLHFTPLPLGVKGILCQGDWAVRALGVLYSLGQ